MSYQIDFYPTEEQLKKVGIVYKNKNYSDSNYVDKKMKDCEYIVPAFLDRIEQCKEDIVTACSLCLVNSRACLKDAISKQTKSASLLTSIVKDYLYQVKAGMATLYYEIYNKVVGSLYNEFTETKDEKTGLGHIYKCSYFNEDEGSSTTLTNYCEFARFDIINSILRNLENINDDSEEQNFLDFTNGIKNIIEDFIENIECTLRTGFLLDLKEEGCIYIDDYNFETISDEDKAKIDEYSKNKGE